MKKKKQISKTLYTTGYSYGLGAFDTQRAATTPNVKKIDLDSIRIGQLLTVADSLIIGKDWISSMEQNLGRTAIVKEIDKTRMVVLLEFEHDEKEVVEEWWFPGRALQKSNPLQQGPHPELHLLSREVLRNELIQTAKLSAQIYLCECALLCVNQRQMLLSLEDLGGSPGLMNVFHLTASKYFLAPLADLSSRPCKQPFLENLYRIVVRLSKQTPQIAHEILDEAFKLLKQACNHMSSASFVKESLHPMEQNTDVIEKIYIPNATALFIVFDHRCKLSKDSRLSFYSDHHCAKLVSHVGESGDASQFRPLIIENDTVYMKASSSTQKAEWGYKFKVMPAESSFNLSIWLSKLLLEECIDFIPEVEHTIFKKLFNYLYAFDIPIPLKVMVMRLMTGVLQVAGLPPDNIRSSDPMRMRDTMKEEMEQLFKPIESLSQEKKDMASVQSSSPYLQTLVELMAEIHTGLRNREKSEANEEPHEVGYPKSIKLFDTVLEFLSIIDCYKAKNQFPFPLIYEGWKHLDQKIETVTILFLRFAF